MTDTTSVVYWLPTSELHGGVRVVFEHADGLMERGYEVTVCAPDGPPDWHDLKARFLRIAPDQGDSLPTADVAIGTYFTTIGEVASGVAPVVFHFCQSFEGIHVEHEPNLPEIDAAYQRPIPKLTVSPNLDRILEGRYGSRCYWVGEALDEELFQPPRRPAAGVASAVSSSDERPLSRPSKAPLRVGLVGTFEARSKGIREGLEGLRLARERGVSFELWRVSTEPLSDEERSLGVTDHFLERLTTAEMPGFYHGLDALLFTSCDEEGFGLPPIEAMACGVPTAIADIPSLVEIPGGSVLRYPFGDPKAIVRILEQFSDLNLRRRLRQEGLAVAKTYTYDRVLDRLEAAFRAEGVRLPAR